MQILILPSPDGRLAVRPLLSGEDTYAPFIEVLRQFPCRRFDKATRTWYLPDEDPYRASFLRLLSQAQLPFLLVRSPEVSHASPL